MQEHLNINDILDLQLKYRSDHDILELVWRIKHLQEDLLHAQAQIMEYDCVYLDREDD